MEHRRPNLFRSFCITLVLLLSLGLCGCRLLCGAGIFYADRGDHRIQHEGSMRRGVSECSVHVL